MGDITPSQKMAQNRRQAEASPGIGEKSVTRFSSAEWSSLVNE